MIRKSQLAERLYHLRLTLTSIDMLVESLPGHAQTLAEAVLEHGTPHYAYEKLLDMLRRVGATEAYVRELESKVRLIEGIVKIPKEEDA